MTSRERERKIAKLHKMRLDLSAEARNLELSAAERFDLDHAADALGAAIEAMEKKRVAA